MPLGLPPTITGKFYRKDSLRNPQATPRVPSCHSLKKSITVEFAFPSKVIPWTHAGTSSVVSPGILLRLPPGISAGITSVIPSTVCSEASSGLTFRD